MRARLNGSRWVCGVLLAITTLAGLSNTAWASTRIGNAEMQMWYRTRHMFHSSGGDNLNWVQWRNEVFFWFVYDDLVKNGKVLNQDNLAIPFIKGATFNARYRFRADPMYSIRKHYQNIYDDEERESFIFPENGFRDLTLDMDLGQVGIGSLALRLGNQQIVWGESDLYRSIDIINPLRIDQGQGVGERFDEFRTPIWALKALYNVGNVGSWFSNVIIEPFWSPRYRSGTSDLILEGGYRLPFHIRGCLDQNNREVAYDPTTCAKLRSSTGERVITQYRPGWLGQSERIRHPFSYFSAGPNPQKTPDYACLNQRCSPDIYGDRASSFANLKKGSFTHVLNGAFNKNQAGGLRVQGTSIWGVDWSLVYIFLPTGESGTYDYNSFLNDSESPTGTAIYGDPALVQQNFPGAPVRGTFEEGLRRCLSDGGKQHETQTGPGKRGFKAGGTVLVGADLFGYNNPGRYKSNNRRGALGSDGKTPVAGAHNAKRPPFTFCLAAQHDYVWSHVPGFTLTYNDFEYTGMVFRVEQSFSTKEVIRKNPTTPGQKLRLQSDNFDRYTGIWRSMVGFDLIRTIPAFRYIPGIHHSFYDQAWFITGQWLMQNHWNNMSNNFCQNVDKAGNQYTKEQVKADRVVGLRSYSTPSCKRERWNNLFTFALVNQGLFASRLETRNAVVLEPSGQQTLLYSQWWWRNVLGYENVELSTGVGWWTGSNQSHSWSGVQHFSDRDQFWFEFTYYLL
ncbi:MAG: hypothetical protein EXR78_09150 [Deltaproteobacteria bacterium]|nr:hypothetical protein [Deltaproteobacteria bacterium]